MNEKLLSVARSALNRIKNDVSVDFRYLAFPLGILEPTVESTVGLYTDGKKMTLGAGSFCEILALEGLKGGERAVLHVLFHILFFHTFRLRRPIEIYDVACDIAVEYLLDSAVGVEGGSKRAIRRAVYDEIEKRFSIVNEKTAFEYASTLSREELERVVGVFKTCDHGLWYGRKSFDGANSLNGGESPSVGLSYGDEPDAEDGESVARWVEIVRGFTSDVGSNDEVLKNALLRVVSTKRDYRRFFEKFVSSTERVKPSEDEFDYVFYCYGLSLYKNMPLVESLEYSDGLDVEQIVFAIDISASTEGEPVRELLAELCSVVGYAAEQGGKISVRVIQCDMRVRQDITLKSREEIDEYFESFNFLGGSGTDFSPVFETLEKDVAQGVKIRGLIYFTDGLAKFPLVAPPFKTCFAIYGDDDRKICVPPYALRLDVAAENRIKKTVKKGVR